jgi:hypothetical protein
MFQSASANQIRISERELTRMLEMNLSPFLGLALGLVQWSVIRKEVKDGRGWIAISALAWFLLAVFQNNTDLSDITIIGALQGLITAICLVRLQKK